jgi:hypothetical protein
MKKLIPVDRLKNRLEAYERLVESQEKTIALLEMQLRNEKLKNNNLSDLYRLSNGATSIED